MPRPSLLQCADEVWRVLGGEREKAAATLIDMRAKPPAQDAGEFLERLHQTRVVDLGFELDVDVP